MSKKPSKTASRPASAAAEREPVKIASKRPIELSADDDRGSGSHARSRQSRRTCRRPRPAPPLPQSFANADAFVWHPDGRLAPVPRVSRVELGLLKGIDRMRDILIENTERFADGLPANNALLWGARGMGKSSLVKAAHASINADRKPAERLKLIEIHREDIESLPALMDLLRASDLPLHRVLRRPVVRRQRRLLQVAEGGAGRRHRGPPRQRHPVCDLEPQASAGARHDRERALDRDQSGRSGRGEGVAVGPLRTVARLPPLQPGRISGDGEGLLRPFRHQDRRGRAGARGAGMVDHARLALGPRRLAVHAGTGGTAGRSKADRMREHTRASTAAVAKLPGQADNDTRNAELTPR